jgi:hypothetical protein
LQKTKTFSRNTLCYKYFIKTKKEIMKNKLQRIAKVMLCCFLLIALSCEKDNALTEQDVKMIEAKTWFNQYESNGANYELFQNLDYNWNKASITKSVDGIETIVIPVNELKESKKEIWEQKLYLYKLDTGNYKALLFEIYPNKDSELSSQSIDGGNFSGYMSTWDLKMGFVRAAKFVDNQVVENGIAKTVSIDKITGKAPPVLPCQDGDCNTGVGGGNPIPLRPVIITGPSTGTPVVYTPRNPVTGGISTGGYTSIGGNGGGGNNSGVIIVIVDPSLANNPCLKAVYDKLGGSATFQQFLKKFDGSFSVANLKLAASSNIANNVNAETSPPQNYLITISFNSNNLNRPSLDVARTFMHEMIHAEMFRKLLSLSASNGEIDVTKLNQMLTQNNYPGLYDYYVRYGINGMQHEQMAAHYRETIISYLKEYDNSLTQEQYESIAWEGLKETTSWKSLSQNEKQRITDVYKNWLSKAGKSCN